MNNYEVLVAARNRALAADKTDAPGVVAALAFWERVLLDVRNTPTTFDPHEFSDAVIAARIYVAQPTTEEG